MWIWRRIPPLLVFALLLAILGGNVLANIVPPECKYEERDRNGKEHRYEGIKHGHPVAGEHLQLLSATVNYQDPALLCISDLRDPISLAVKLRDAAESFSRYLQQQLSPGTQELLELYDESATPSEPLQKALIYELNQIIVKSIYDEALFAGVVLSAKTQDLAGQSPQGKRLVHFNRLLLEDTYPDEIIKSQYLQEISPDPPGKINVGFYSDMGESNLDITVIEYDRIYYMDPVKEEYQAGFNNFSWDNSVIKELRLDLRNLRAKAKVKREGRVIVKPAILYDVPLPGKLRVESYDFVFIPDLECDVKYTIRQNGEVRSKGCCMEREDGREVPITWECEDAEEGWYQLVVDFCFQSLGKSMTINLPPHNFYHKPELEIP